MIKKLLAMIFIFDMLINVYSKWLFDDYVVDLAEILGCLLLDGGK